MLGVSLCVTPFARAEETVDNAADEDSMSALQQQVNDTATVYNDAAAKVDDLNTQIADTEARIAELEKELPEQEERSNQAVKTLYLFQQDASSMLDMLLSADSFGDFINSLQYLNRINTYNLDAIDAAKNMKQELEDSKASLEADRQSAESVKLNAANALAEAQSARQAAAEAAAAAQQTADEQAAAEAAQAAAAESGSSNTGSGSANASDVDWSSDKASFVNYWAARIDSYLAGSPMEGCGTDYASSAWDHGVDPRFAPAISAVESSKGAYCYRSYNAWGYGGINFGSWAEGIERVTRCLGNDQYQGSLTLDDGYRYAADGEAWYNAVYAQMMQI